MTAPVPGSLVFGRWIYQDADATNDPPLIGEGGGPCVFCHNK